MKNLRLLAIFAIWLTLVLALTACGGSSGDNANDGDASSNDNQTTTATTPVSPVEPADPGIHTPRDLGGGTITFGGWWEGVLPFAPTNPDWEPDPATSGNYLIDRMIWDNARRVEQEFNISFYHNIIYYHDNIPLLTASVMAGDPISDIQMLSGGMTLNAVVGNLIHPLDTINLPGSDILGANVFAHIVSSGMGHDWTFIDNQPDPHGTSLGVNLDIINAIGAPNPVELYNQGRWGWNEMMEIMRMATQDTTGDGIIDQFGIAGQPSYITMHLVGGNDGEVMSPDFQFYFDSPNTMQALEFAESIFLEGLWQYDRSGNPNIYDWGLNFWAYLEGRSALFVTATWALQDGQPSFDYAVVPFPTGPANTSGNTWLTGWVQGLALPAGSAWAPSDLLMIAEELYSWPGSDPGLMMEGGMGWPRQILPTEECVQRQLSTPRTRNSQIAMSVPHYSWFFTMLTSNMVSQEMGLLPFIEAHRAPQQELLDAIFAD